MADIIAKRMVCLANSRKKGDRCIAGKELLADGSPGDWVRPVSGREDEAVNEIERRYRDGTEPAVLDVIDVPLIEARPKGHQQETWLLNPGHYWTREKRISVEDLHRLVDRSERLWINGYQTYHGCNDRLPLECADPLDRSLRFICVEALDLYVFAPGESFGNRTRRVHGWFSYANDEYGLRVTDPIYEQKYRGLPYGPHSLGRCYLTVSLGEPYKGYVYKLIAAIIES